MRVISDDSRPRSLRAAAAPVIAAVCALLAASACEERKPASEATSSRGNEAKVGARQTATVEAFCDAHFAAGAGPAFQWPALAGGETAAPAAGKGWRWVNVWATWCKPCVEEMPRLRAWRDKLTAAGKPLELAFMSIDESDDDIAAFRKQHPDTPPSTRIAQVSASGAWMRGLGLEGDPPIPVHFFVDGTNRVRCARAGGVREQDYAAVEKLLAN